MHMCSQFFTDCHAQLQLPDLVIELGPASDAVIMKEGFLAALKICADPAAAIQHLTYCMIQHLWVSCALLK